MLSQKTVSTHVYLLYVMLTDTKPNAVSECESELFFDIGHSLFDIRRDAGYLMDIRNIQYSKFDI